MYIYILIYNMSRRSYIFSPALSFSSFFTKRTDIKENILEATEWKSNNLEQTWCLVSFNMHEILILMHEKNKIKYIILIIFCSKQTYTDKTFILLRTYVHQGIYLEPRIARKTIYTYTFASIARHSARCHSDYLKIHRRKRLRIPKRRSCNILEEGQNYKPGLIIYIFYSGWVVLYT